ncbi:MAG TPA: hypothetical protein VFC23_11115 [Thermoanaerobaculia bacterium]|nr:hypothetical protein [Thermoanaerobaculia bacterium]
MSLVHRRIPAALSLLVWLLTGGAVAPAAPAVTAAQPWKQLADREARYLEMELAQIRKLQSHFKWIGRQPLAVGALAAAALADRSDHQGRPDAPQLRAEAARWVAGVLDSCTRWYNNECGRSQLPLERLVLQYPQALPPELLARLRQAVSDAAPPPGAGQVQNPWSFADTENQRMVTLARSLVAQVVAGTPDSPAAKGWGAFAEAFLRAHDRDGWYEAESPGYLALSLTGLLQLADHAPQATVRDLARRQLDLLLATWAQNQVGGFPAGPKSRTNGAWALTPRSTPWAAWTWLAAGIGNPDDINFMDRPELPVSRYAIPEGVVRLLTERRRQPPYEILERRRIEPARRRSVDAALYAWATPDYVLGAAQTVGNLALRVSGGQEIVATLYAESPEFAPLYLWSRTKTPENDEANELNTLDQAVASRNLVVARLDTPGEGVGHAYLAPPWSRPEPLGEAGDVVVSRCGDTYVALATAGGWEVAPAPARFPDYYGPADKPRRGLAGSWVAVPKRQPASVGLQVGRRAADGDFAAWKKQAAAARLALAENGEIRFTAGGGGRLDFLPGRQAKIANQDEKAGKALEPAAYPRLSAPFLSSPAPGRWSFSFGETRLRFEPLEVPRPAP